MLPATPSPDPSACHLTLVCDFALVQPAAHSVQQFLTEQGCAPEEIMDCEFALVEACNNAMKYVGPEARAAPIQVDVVCHPEEVEIRVTDHTPGFDWPEKAALPDPESESGRGLFLIQSVTDHANYTRGAKENVLVMRKRRAARPG